jgi:hypothetical protein
MKNTIKMDELTIFDSSLLTTDYQAINPLGFAGPAVSIKINNDASIPVWVSYDGIHDHDLINLKNEVEFRVQANAMPNNKVAMFRKGTVVYLKGDFIPLKGGGKENIYLTVYYLES